MFNPKASSTMGGVTFRAARDDDASALIDIINPYIQETVISFYVEPLTQQDMLKKIQTTRSANLPFIVAVDSTATILGYISASDFRDKPAYMHSIEVSLFCRAGFTGHKIGSRLMNLFVSISCDPQSHRQFVPDGDNFRKVKQVLACMAVDSTGPKQGLALKEFYEKCGFVQVAHLPKIGYKFDRWVDVVYMQRSLW